MRYLIFFILLFINLAVLAQNEQLARNYVEQGEYAKAKAIYEKLYKKQKFNTTYFMGLVNAHQQLEEYKEVESLLLEKIKQSPQFPNTYIELGHNYELQDKITEANTYYQEALALIDQNPNSAYIIGSTFQKYNKLDEAITAYEKGMTLNPKSNFDIQLARLYGEQGNIEKMFNSYLDLVNKNPQYMITANRNIEQFISEDPYNDGNVILKTLLLKRLQQDPKVLYNEMLSWLFIQQKEYKKAFLQEKAVYLRTQETLEGIIDVALIAIEDNDNDAARDILSYIVKEARLPETKLRAHELKLGLDIKNATPKHWDYIEDEFSSLFQAYGKSIETMSLQIAYANFLAFKKEQTASAISTLKNLLDQDKNRFQEATIKMALADILVLDEKFNQALIYYSQIQNIVKNNTLSQEARFKVAKTSYYKGDFSWSETQLDVLKASASQLIANDAMELSLLIKDNSLEDSTQTALKKFAKADLLTFKGKNEAAIAVLEEILIQHKGEKIEDEALLRQANLFIEAKEFEKAEANYKKIITFYPTDILGDDAYYGLAKLYDEHLARPEDAKANYEKVIFDYADSIFYVDARKRYRTLRGDAIN